MMHLLLVLAALRHLGTARTGAYFSLAPFIGALLSLIIFKDALTLQRLRDHGECRGVVVDDEDPQGGRRAHWACTPGANFGTRTITFVPAPGAVSTTRP